MSKSTHASSIGIVLAALAAVTASAGPGKAADYLRGAYGGEMASAAAPVDWAGYYAGVHSGMTVAEVNSSKFSGPLADSALPNATIHGPLLRDSINFRAANVNAASYGAFVGFNALWDDVVLGIEADYSHSKINANRSTGPYGLIRTDGTIRYTVGNVVANSRGQINDWGTLRLRVGQAMGNFLPYMTIGLALGNVNSRATTSGTAATHDVSNPLTPVEISSGPFSGLVGRRGIAYGGAYGAGVDMQLFPGMFLRAEYQGAYFSGGDKRPDITLHTARVGGGVKF